MWSKLYQLFLSFFQIGLFSIGGGYATIPLIQEQVVTVNGWLTFQEFTDIITISQMTPGPIAVNTSTFVGLRILGIPGAMVATLGCVISGFIISLLLYRFFAKFSSTKGVLFMLKGLRAVSIGLIASSAGTILLMALCGTSAVDIVHLRINMTALVLLAVSLLLLRKFKWNPIYVIAASGVFGILIYGFR